MMLKCFGIVSWLPDDTKKRVQREKRLNNLFIQLNKLFSDIDILVISQNGKDYKIPEIKNKVIRIDFENGLGILGARKTLRKEFLKLNYNYIIMVDDDCQIELDEKDANKKFIEELDAYKDGFCFQGRKDAKEDDIDPYCSAQLNMCAISKFIFEKEDYLNLDPQKGGAYEDDLYAVLLRHKYSKYEFKNKAKLHCTQFLDPNAPSTGATNMLHSQIRSCNENTAKIKNFIVEYKDAPDIDIFLKYGVLISKGAHDGVLKNALKRKEYQEKRNFGYNF